MDIIREIQSRRSVRKYLERPVSDADIRQILEAARLAPSGNNTQPWKFMVIRDEEKKRRIASADHEQKWLLSAPVFLVCLADMSRRTEGQQVSVDENTPCEDLKRVIRDAAIAVTHILLEAEHLGLSTCWTGWYTQKEMREALGVADSYYVSGVIALGYGAEAPAPRPRRELDDMILEWDK